MKTRPGSVLCSTALAAALGIAASAPAAAQISDDVVRLGLLLDLNGPYSDASGQGAIEAARMAIEDFGGEVLGKKIDLLVADHQNKADLASALAREWTDTRQLDAILDTNGTAPALAVQELARQRNFIAIFTSAAALRLTNESCAPTTIHYAYDTYAQSRTTAEALVREGYDSWYFIALDSAFGTEIVRDASEVVEQLGGKVLGVVKHPLATTDYSSFLLAAQSSGAKVIGVGNAGNNTIDLIKNAREFGITGGQKIATLYALINTPHAIGLEAAQGMVVTEAFYWDLDDETRAWSKRYFERRKSMPNAAQASVYSAATHYLKSVQAAGTDETAAVMKKMRETPVQDFFARNGKIREDGRMVHDMYFLEVKSPAESKGPWDIYKLRATIPGDKAFLPLEKSRCPLVKK